MHRFLVSYARPEAFMPLARSILSKIGYSIVALEELESLPPEMAARRPDLRIVDERRLGEVSDEEDEVAVPVIVLTGRSGVSGVDSRIVGAIARPAGLHELYRLIQEALEDTPRSIPRVTTHLQAYCRRLGREWQSSVLSLSENGCLLRSSEPLPLGSELDIALELPNIGCIETRAETAYQLPPDLGLVFHATPAMSRAAIARFVSQTLAKS
jgi:hypothetical protein